MLDRQPMAGPELTKTTSPVRLIGDYLTLTKPLIIMLLLITALGGMFLAAHGVPPLRLAALVCLGGALGAGGANALNHYVDRDIDQVMSRTCGRPLPGNRVEPHKALVLGILLNVAAFLVLTAWVNLLAASLTLAATLFYVFVYTIWLKRSTPQNIVIGGAAGSIPPLVGWAAITGGLGLPALYLFAIILFWTPPHFWALALLIQEDYEQANIPMLPVVVGSNRTARSIFLYVLALVVITLMLALTSSVGWLYFAAALMLGGLLIGLAGRLVHQPSIRRAKQLYLYSLLYLALLFVAMMVDSTLAL